MTQPFRILLVDDEVLILRSLRRVLLRQGYEVLTATDPEQALSLLAREDVDLVIADERMPRMSGLDFLRHVRRQHPWALRFLLTGQADIATALAAINDSVTHKFLLKPWDDAELREVVEDALRSLRSLDPSAATGPVARDEHGARERLERTFPGITTLDRDEDGSIVIEPVAAERPGAWMPRDGDRVRPAG